MNAEPRGYLGLFRKRKGMEEGRGGVVKVVMDGKKNNDKRRLL